MIRIVLTTVLLASATIASAHEGETNGSKFDFEAMQVVTKLAMEDMVKLTPEHTEHVVGFKTWKQALDARVKIYIDHNGKALEANYLCHIHDNGPECHKM